MNQTADADESGTAAFLERVAAQDEMAGRARRVSALATIVKTVRARDGKSIERSAKDAGIGHMTWRRLEEGNAVRAQTYAALDRLYNLRSGTILAAVANDRRMAELAVVFDVGSVEQAKRMSDEGFVTALAGGEDATVTDEWTGPDRVIARATVEIKDGVEVSTGVTGVVKAAPLPVIMRGLVSRLVENQENLTSEEGQILKAAMEYSATLRWSSGPKAG